MKKLLNQEKKEVSKTISELEQLIIKLKTQLQETKRKEEILNKQLNEKQKICKILEDEIVQLKGKIEKEDIQSKFENNDLILKTTQKS